LKSKLHQTRHTKTDHHMQTTKAQLAEILTGKLNSKSSLAAQQ
jgi:hypothetical protein